MKLLSVIHGPAYGGAHNQAAVLVGPLRELGVETVVVLPVEARAAAHRLLAAGVDVSLTRLSRPRATLDPRPNLRLARGLRREIAKLAELASIHGADLIQAHGPTNPHAAFAAREAGLPLVWQLLDSRAPRPVLAATMPLVLRHADVVTSWGEGLARAHPGSGRLGTRLVPVYPPVDRGRFRVGPERRDEARARLDLEAEEIAVVSVGVLNPQKGHEHLLEAFSRIAPANPALRLRILGASSPAHAGYEAELRGAAARIGDGRTVQILDPGSSVPDLLGAADVFVLASAPRSEGMPTAILEAMALGIPVVASRVGSVDELVADGESGILVPAADPTALAGALSRIATDAGLRSSLGARGLELADERFGLERLAGLHLGAFERARANHAAGTPSRA